jgi:hypothetical protein
MPTPQFALCHHQSGPGLVLLARHTTHRACVAAQPPCSWHLPQANRPPARRARRSRPSGCIDTRLHPVTTTAIRHTQEPPESVLREAMIDCKALAAQIALYGAPIAAIAQGLTAVAETLRLSELVDFVVESCLVGGQDTFADCLYLVDPGVSRVSGLEYGGYQRIEALPGTKRAPSRNTSAASSSS